MNAPIITAGNGNGFPRRTFLAGSLFAVGAAALAACTPGGAATNSNAAVRIMLPLYGTAPDKNGTLQKAIEEYTGRKLNFSWVPSADYPDKTTVTLASGELPDLMCILRKDQPGFIQSAEAGAFWDLTGKLDKFPNLIAADEAVDLAASVNGVKHYGLFRLREPLGATTMYRQDWLDTLGLAIPETVEEWRTVAEAFVTERPGGTENTGLALSSWGAIYGGGSPYEMIESWFGSPNGWGERGGKLVPAFDTEEFLEADTFLRGMRADGLLNADFATLNNEGLDNAFFNGTAGMLVGGHSAVSFYADLFNEVDPGNGASYVGNGGNLIGPDGDRHAMAYVGYAGYIAVSKQNIKSDAQLDELLTMLDKLNEPEGQRLLQLGIEDVSYELDGDYYVPIDTPEGKTISENAGQAFGHLYTAVNGRMYPERKPATAADQAMYDRIQELLDRDIQVAVHDDAAAFVSPTAVSQGAVLNQIIGDARVQYISGQIDEAGYKDEIKRWHTAGGDDVIAEINELYEAAQ